MAVGSAATNPNGWDWGPPKSDDEGWRFARRGEILDTARMFMLHYIRTRESSEFAEHTENDHGKEVRECVRLAEMLVDEVDARHPRA